MPLSTNSQDNQFLQDQIESDLGYRVKALTSMTKQILYFLPKTAHESRESIKQGVLGLIEKICNIDKNLWGYNIYSPMCIATEEDEEQKSSLLAQVGVIKEEFVGIIQNIDNKILRNGVKSYIKNEADLIGSIISNIISGDHMKYCPTAFYKQHITNMNNSIDDYLQTKNTNFFQYLTDQFRDKVIDNIEEKKSNDVVMSDDSSKKISKRNRDISEEDTNQSQDKKVRLEQAANDIVSNSRTDIPGQNPSLLNAGQVSRSDVSNERSLG
jgi:hypothetical protein